MNIRIEGNTRIYLDLTVEDALILAERLSQSVRMLLHKKSESEPVQTFSRVTELTFIQIQTVKGN